jgi:AcrR family transcriptional regulator
MESWRFPLLILAFLRLSLTLGGNLAFSRQLVSSEVLAAVDADFARRHSGVMSPLPAIQRLESRGKRALILQEAAATLNRRGVTQTFLTDIGARVGVTRAALYYYFDDQQDLVFQCYRASCEVMARRLTEAELGRHDALAVIERFVDLLLTEDEPELAVLSETAFLAPEFRNTIVGLYEGLIARIGAILHRGVERGEVRPCDTRLCAMMVLGVVSWIPLQERWDSTAAFSHARLAAAARALIFEGIAADRTEPIAYQPLTLSSARLSTLGVFDGAQLALAKQEALLAAASWLFNLKGVDATSLEEIAACVGVTKKVIYHNVGDKDAVVIACYLRSLAFAISIAEQARDQAPSQLAAFCRLMHVHAEARLRRDIAPLSGVGALDALREPGRAQVNDEARRLLALTSTMFDAGRAEGSLRDFDAGALMSITPGIVEWIPKWLSAETPTRRAEISRELATFYGLGLRPV